VVITEFDELYGLEVPDAWSVEKLEPKVGNVKSGKRLPKGYYVVDTPTNHPYIRVIDMKEGYVDTGDLKYVPEEAFPAIQNYRIYIDDIYISVAGTLGIVGQIPIYLDGANLTENANRITNIKCNIKYLMYWLMGSIIQSKISQTQTLGAQPKLALTRIRNFPVILPPEKEQQKIAGVLSDIDTLITDLQKLIRKKKDIRQGTMQMLVTGKKRLDGFSKPWRVVSFDDICAINAPMVNPQENQYAFLPHIGNESIDKHTGKLLSYNKVIDDNLISGKYYFTENDVLYGKINPQFGKVAFPQFEGLCSADMYPITCKDGIIPQYLKQALLTYDFLQFTIPLSLRSGMPKVNRKELSEYKFLLPEIEEQKRITSILTDMDSEIEILEEKLSKYQKIKQGMMEELLTGKVRLV
jgi:type I restriction enzyme S subunit